MLPYKLYYYYYLYLFDRTVTLALSLNEEQINIVTFFRKIQTNFSPDELDDLCMVGSTWKRELAESSRIGQVECICSDGIPRVRPTQDETFRER